MPAFAQKITLDESTQKITIDGAEHPWLVGDRGVILGPEYQSDKAPTRVDVTFLVTDLEVVEPASNGLVSVEGAV